MKTKVKLIYPYNLFETLQFPKDHIWFIPYGTATEEQKERLEEMIASLDPEEQVVLHKHFREEVSDPEMAATVGKSVSATNQILWRAIRKLKTPQRASYIVVGDGEDPGDVHEWAFQEQAGSKMDLYESMATLERLWKYGDISSWQYKELLKKLN